MAQDLNTKMSHVGIRGLLQAGFFIPIFPFHPPPFPPVSTITDHLNIGITLKKEMLPVYRFTATLNVLLAKAK